LECFLNSRKAVLAISDVSNNKSESSGNEGCSPPKRFLGDFLEALDCLSNTPSQQEKANDDQPT
jgi:hypothetical protein